MEKKIVLNSIKPNAYGIAIDFGTGEGRDSGLIIEQKEGKSFVSHRKTGEQEEMRKEFYNIETEEGRQELLDDLNRYGLAGKHYSVSHAIRNADPFSFTDEALDRELLWCYEDSFDLGWFFNTDDVLEEVDRLQREADDEALKVLESHEITCGLGGEGPCYAADVWCDDDDEQVEF